MCEILCYVLCNMSVGTVNILAFSLCFLKLFANLTPADSNAANAPEMIGPAVFSCSAENMVRGRLKRC